MENIVRDLATLEWCSLEAYFLRFVIRIQGLLLALLCLAIMLNIECFLQGCVNRHGIGVVTLGVEEEVCFRVMIHFLDKVLVVVVIANHEYLSQVFFDRLARLYFMHLCHWFHIE